MKKPVYADLVGPLVDGEPYKLVVEYNDGSTELYKFKSKQEACAHAKDIGVPNVAGC